MSYLIQLKSRINATEVTKKTTNAMRLIAMSTHLRLRQIKLSLDLYKRNIENTVKEITLHENNQQDIPASSRKLFILIGSQKGLCGNYNANVANYFQKNLTQITGNDLIIIGKQIKERLLFQGIKTMKVYDQFSLSVLNKLVTTLADYVLSSTYESVNIMYTKPKTFFLQSHETAILKREHFMTSSNNATHSEISEQSYEVTFNFLGHLFLKALIEEILIDSLIAEASSRFISMDAATRNADDLIAHMKLDYNKLRQASITRELTDLAGIYLQKS